MPMTDAELKDCESYLGTNPCPADFDAFWAPESTAEVYHFIG